MHFSSGDHQQEVLFIWAPGMALPFFCRAQHGFFYQVQSMGITNNFFWVITLW